MRILNKTRSTDKHVLRLELSRAEYWVRERGWQVSDYVIVLLISSPRGLDCLRLRVDLFDHHKYAASQKIALLTPRERLYETFV